MKGLKNPDAPTFGIRSHRDRSQLREIHIPRFRTSLHLIETHRDRYIYIVKYPQTSGILCVRTHRMKTEIRGNRGLWI